MPENDSPRKINDLYGLPLEEFTNARNELARELRNEGDREEAARIGKLRKPTVAAWVANQLSRHEKMNVRALLTAGERLRKAHADVMSGESLSVLEPARSAERKAIEALARAAAKILESGRGTASSSVLDEVRETLHAAAVDPELGERLRAGRLEREAKALGFGFEAASPGPSPPQPKAAKRREARNGRRRAAETRLADARARVDEARKQLRETEEDAKRAKAEHDRAERDAERRRAELGRAEAAVEQAEERLRRLDGGRA